MNVCSMIFLGSLLFFYVKSFYWKALFNEWYKPNVLSSFSYYIDINTLYQFVVLPVVHDDERRFLSIYCQCPLICVFCNIQ